MVKDRESKSDEDEEIVVDDDILNNNPQVALKKLRDKLKTCQTERQEFLTTSQRLKADYLNLRRTEKEAKELAIRFAKEPILLELIKLADSFELAFQNKNVWEAVAENWRQGVEQLYAQLVIILKQNGLTEIDSLKQHFNPAEHQAIATIDTDTPAEDNIVLEVVQKGYKLHDRIIRPTQVKVGRFIRN